MASIASPLEMSAEVESCHKTVSQKKITYQVVLVHPPHLLIPKAGVKEAEIIGPKIGAAQQW